MSEKDIPVSNSDEKTIIKPHQKVLLDGLVNFYKERVLCDVTLKAEDVAVPAHRCVLAASSNYFR